MNRQSFEKAGAFIFERVKRLEIHTWAKKHKLAAVIAVLLLAFLLWPKSTPKLRGVATGDASALPKPAPAASTQPVTAQRAGDVELYAPDQEGADPSWSLPAELKSSDVKSLAQQVDKLLQDIPATSHLEQQCNESIGQLFTAQYISLFWSRLKGQGFHDANLPLDWYEVIKERNSFLGNAAVFADAFTNQLVQTTIAMRLVSVEVRIIGGKVLVGDMLFVKASQAYVDQRKPHFERLLPLVQSVTQRMQQEFQKEPSQSGPQH